MRGKDETVIGAVHIVRNVTERQLAEEQLKESEARFKNMFQSHSAIMLLVNPEDYSIIDVNSSAEKFYGYSRETMLSMKITEINILSLEAITAELHAAELSGTKYFTFQHRLANGEIRVVEVHTTPIIFNDKTLLFSIIHDITQKIENESIYNAIFNQAAVGIARIETPGRFIEVNKRFCDMLGYTRSELLHKTFHEITHPDYLSRDVNLVKLAFDGSIPNFTVDKRYLCKSGEYIWAQLTLAVTRHQDGSPNFAIESKLNK